MKAVATARPVGRRDVSLRPYLPAPLVSHCLRAPDGPPVWGEWLEGSLMHCDITGFTAMSEALASLGNEGAELMTGVLNHFFEAMLEIGELWGGYQLKFGGDAMLLIFAGPDHASRAAACGLAMQVEMREFRHVLAGGQQHELRMRVGIHSGRFFSASLGDPERALHYMVAGPAANRAAQVEAAATPGQVAVSREAAALLSPSAVVSLASADIFRVRSIASPPCALSREAYSQNVDRLLARYLMTPVASLLDRGRGEALAPEHRRVTPVFIGLLGTGELLANNGEDETVRQLNTCVRLVIECAERHGGALSASDVADEGEKLIVLFGAPVAHEGEEASALRFALDLGEALRDARLDLKHRIGIASGFVYAGEVGFARRREYTVIGDFVNLAARLMARAKWGETIISDRTAARAGSDFALRRLRPVRVKGKSAPVRPFRLDGLAQTAATSADAAPMFGREKELAQLIRLARRAEVPGGRSGWAHIAGEAGIGKSRLVRELATQLTNRGWQHIASACHAYTAQAPFAPWLPVLRTLLDIRHNLTDADAWQRLQTRVAELAPDATDFAPLLAELMRIPIANDVRTPELDARARQQQLFHLIVQIFGAANREQPLLLTIEDLHWSDAPSRALLAALLAPKQGRLLVCLSSRTPEPPPEIANLKNGTVLNLGVLPAEDARRLLLQQGVAAEHAEPVLRRAQGNPLFLQEIARRSSGAGLPETINDVVMARLDSLPPEDRSLIRAASVIGAAFEPSVLRHLVEDRADASITTSLRRLRRLGFTVDLPSGEGYAFNHVLTQQVAYETLPYQERRRLHGRVGSQIEAAQAGRLETVCELLLHHFEAAQESRKTALYALMSGDRAATVFANQEAIAFYERSITAVERTNKDAADARSLLTERIGDCLETSGRHTEATSRYEDALSAWRRRSRRSRLLPAPEDAAAREAALCRKLAVSSERGAHYDGSLRWLDEALRSLPGRRARLAAQIYAGKSVVHFRIGQYNDGVSWGIRAVALARRSGDARLIAYARNMLANSYMERGELHKAGNQLRHAVRLYGEIRDFPGQASANNNLGKCYHLQGVYDAALYHYQVALSADDRAGDAVDVVIEHHNIGEALLALGRIVEAEGHFDEVVAAMKRDPDLIGVAGLAETNLSRCRQATGDLIGAEAHLRRGLRLLRRVGAAGPTVEALLQRAELSLAQARLKRALAEARRGLAEARGLGSPLLESRGERLLGIALSALGRGPRAERELQAAIVTARSLGAQHEEALAQTALGAHLLGGRGRRGEARRMLSRAVSVLARMGAAPDLAKAQQLLHGIER